MSMILPLLGLVLTLAACAGLIALGLRRIRARRELVTHGIRIPAEIISVKARGMASTWAYYPTVRYQLHGRHWHSKPVSGQLALNPRGLKSHNSGDQYIGHPLDIVVDRHNPSSSAVPYRDRLGIFIVVIGSVFGAITLLLGVIGITASIFIER